ncbi:MAG: hypothetical protein JO079_08675 [Frankiaceae bacterium]|nr:hypothetical protein [Frankiaceae bacterium]MBV9369115.1 hypothetical protein [Frankiales bacterium]
MRRLILALTVGVSALAPVILAPTAANAAVPAPRPPVTLPVGIEPMPPYQPQTFCDPHDKPGVVAFGALLMATYKDTSVVSISRPCGTDTSEHYEGRALDWGVYYKNAAQVAEVNAVFGWLFAKDAAGNPNAMLRRLGIMYVIWNKQIWGAWSQKWEPYSCSGETGCHQNHVHFSFDWSGALKKTSFWTGVVSSPMAPPHPLFTSLTTTQTVKVPATSDGVTTWFSLKAGLRYRVTVSGIYHYRQVRGYSADAECSSTYASPQWSALAPGETSPATGLLRLAVNGTPSGWRAVVPSGGGCNTSNHTYTGTLAPTTSGPITLAVNDPDRYDDTGALTVTVVRLP